MLSGYRGWPDLSFIDALPTVAIFHVEVTYQSDREKTCQLPTENNASFKHSSCISHIKVTFETWLVLCQITV